MTPYRVDLPPGVKPADVEVFLPTGERYLLKQFRPDEFGWKDMLAVAAIAVIAAVIISVVLRLLF